MENLAAGHAINRISVPVEEARLAKYALENMLSIH
jgi:quinolinate synthase